MAGTFSVRFEGSLTSADSLYTESFGSSTNKLLYQDGQAFHGSVVSVRTGEIGSNAQPDSYGQWEQIPSGDITLPGWIYMRNVTSTGSSFVEWGAKEIGTGGEDIIHLGRLDPSGEAWFKFNAGVNELPKTSGFTNRRHELVWVSASESGIPMEQQVQIKIFEA